MKTVGVVMATYNGEEFLREQLDSIIKQTQPPQQIVIVDDCSKDKTCEIIYEYINRFPGLILYIENKENLGPKKAFETGISNCSTDYIALSDQDDVWESEKIAKQYKLLETNKHAKLCFHDLKLINSKGKHIGPSYWEVALDQLPVTGNDARKRLINCLNPVPGCSMFFSSDLKQHILPMPSSKWICHDWWLCVISFFLNDPVFVRETLTKYRLHPSQAAGIRIDLQKEREQLSIRKLFFRIKRETKRLFNKKSSREIRLIGQNKIRYTKSMELMKLIEKWGDVKGSHNHLMEHVKLKSEIAKNIKDSHAFLKERNEI